MIDIIEERLEQVREKIAAAARASGRSAGDISLVAVSKTRTAEEVVDAIRCGQLEFGENRVQEYQSKRPEVDAQLAEALREGDDFQKARDALGGAEFAAGCVRWHIIGPLQTNKVKYLRDSGAMIQTLDRMALADMIVKRMGGAETLVQVNISGEEQKSGLDPAEVERFIESLEVHGDAIKVRGLMCVAENAGDAVVGRQFEQMRELFERMKGAGYPWYSPDYLSMGMSGDFELAIREGANMVRIGTNIFGGRA